jgi:hypothetical protein
MNTIFMKSMDAFKNFMLSESVPNYVQRYCSNLNEGKWIWFYSQMTEAVLITDELDYLFYVLKWILKCDFKDIAYEMFCIDMTDPECRKQSLIKDSLWDVYSQHYFPVFVQDFGLSH